MKESVAIFIHYSTNHKVEKYVKFYIEKILDFFDSIIVVTNLVSPSVNDFSNNLKVSVIKEETNNYDFGKFYLAFKHLNLDNYDKIALINDSAVLFNDLDLIFTKGDSLNKDFWGITDSKEIVPGYITQNTYHIQSYFLIFNKKAIPILDRFFKNINIEEFFKQNLSVRELRMKIVVDLEIGLSQFMLKNNITAGSIFSCNELAQKFKRDINKLNLHIALWKELIEMGYPFIKRKIVTNGFDPVYEKNLIDSFLGWQTIIKEYSSEEFKKLNII